ncbi:tyrosine-type recombinase/integrase [Desulfococcus sp.]|uniref:tyrosine-type recombinase/integrase n=1 Tax=Desulfococcus sp. TaxID=2025834 RepID=UPI003593A2DE
MAFSGLCEAYLDFCQGRFQPNTIRQKAFVFRSLVGFVRADFEAATLTTTTVEAFLAEQRQIRGPKAANRDLPDLKALYNWASRRGLTPVETARSIAMITSYPEERPRKYIPTAEDFNRVLMVAQGDERDLLLVLYHTAGRRGEIIERLTWEDVNFQNRFVRLHTRKRKGGSLEGRTIPMNQILHDVLWRRGQHRDQDSPFVFTSAKTGGRYSREAKKGMMTRLCHIAGVKPFTLHAIRHLVASILSDSHKASPRQIQAFLGHQRIDTTEHYLHEIRPMDNVVAMLEQPLTTESSTKSSTNNETEAV